MRPRPRPKIFCEAEAKTYEAEVEAEATESIMNHATYKYMLLSYRISYVIKPTSIRQNSHSKTLQ